MRKVVDRLRIRFARAANGDGQPTNAFSEGGPCSVEDEGYAFAVHDLKVVLFDFKVRIVEIAV